MAQKWKLLGAQGNQKKCGKRVALRRGRGHITRGVILDAHGEEFSADHVRRVSSTIEARFSTSIEDLYLIALGLMMKLGLKAILGRSNFSTSH
ncbi:hypothetical protein L195_g053676 [Trifolium pratense]|uniref:Uncharacterized protein n=1 Tax=Trifolium pratense TaxID=57577 RepID=A0A2K3KBV5_TRIPR|nr:hypothetical protein L195_g053676 [Trifolium pratense]